MHFLAGSMMASEFAQRIAGDVYSGLQGYTA